MSQPALASAAPDSAGPLLELRGIHKGFGGIPVLKDVNLAVYAGEIHALVGENGAGKSTLLKIIFGAHRADSGSMRLNGSPATFRNPHEALGRGVSMVHQEISLVPQLTAVQNIVLGRERSRLGVIDWADARRQALGALRKLEFNGDPHAPVSRLSVAQQQVVELARAVAADARIIILDEPTASLSVRESETLFAILRELRANGHALIYVSHRLAEVLDLADRATILRDGRLVGAMERGPALTEKSLVQLMVGRSLEAVDDYVAPELGEPMLKVEGLARKGVFDGIHFTLHRKEILGIAGMVGSGRTEIARAIVGADKLDSGFVEIAGQRVTIRSPADAVKAGIAFLTEDRKAQGLVLHMSVASNATLASLRAKLGVVNRREQRSLASQALARVRASAISPGRPARQLSGGTQQKVVLAKWLLTKSNIFIFDEPTRGIDVGAKAEIYQLMRNLVNAGAAVLMISSEMPELLRMSDRIIVMRAGSIAGELSRAAASEERIVALASGGTEWTG
jgi:ABC-type sugar transport system ATPase subunit